MYHSSVKIPDRVSRLFYRYKVERLDTETHADLIILTVLEHGSLDDWRWLFGTYGWDRIKSWVNLPEHSMQMNPPMESFWTLILLGVERKRDWYSGGNGLRIPSEVEPDWLSNVRDAPPHRT